MCFSYEEWLGMHKRCKVCNILLWPSSITMVFTIAATICGRLRTMVACRRQRTHSAWLALCEVNPPVTGGFPSQIASNVEFYITFACVRHRTYDMMVSWHGNALTLLALCEGEPPVTGGFPSQIASNVEFDITFACVRHRTYDMMVWHDGIMTWERSHITGSLWGGTTSHWWLPLTNSQ